MRTTFWNWESRTRLKDLLSEGYPVSTCAHLLGVTRPTVALEIKRGTTEEEYKSKKHFMYRPVRAMLVQVFEGVDTETIREVVDKMKEEARQL